MLLVPVLLVVLLLGHGAQAIYFNTRPVLIIPARIAQIPLEPKVRGISTVSTKNYQLPDVQKTSTPTAITQTPNPGATLVPQPNSTHTTSAKSEYASELLEALNNYRGENGQTPLSIDPKLQNYAKQRSDYYLTIGKIDNHDGFNNLLKNDGFKKLGFMELAENSSFGYNLSAADLIETVFAKSDYHNKNMLNPTYTHIGISVSGSATNFVFGGRKI